MGDGLLSPDAAALMAALENSLALAACEDEERLGLMLDDSELTPRMLAVGAEGIRADWDETWHEGLLVLGRPDSARPANWPPPQPPRKRPRRSDKRVMRPLLTELDQRAMAAAEIYAEIKPDGRALSGAEAAAVRAHLRDQAGFDRRLDIASGALARVDWQPIVLILSEMRSPARNLVLALSDNPQRRAPAIGEGESRARAWVLNERIQGATWEQAYARVQAIARAAAAEADGAEPQ